MFEPTQSLNIDMDMETDKDALYHLHTNARVMNESDS
jgi:hypothetical protein